MGAKKSLFHHAWREAERHKYLASMEAGEDLGDRAIDEWQQRYWTLWLRHRWLEHLLGDECYKEFDPELLGVLSRRFGSLPLLREIVDQVRGRAENADVFAWAIRELRHIPPVVAILTEMRVNDIRCTRFCFGFARGK